MKQTQLKRKTPLKRYKALKAKVGLKKVAMKHKRKRSTVAWHELVLISERDNGNCCEWHGNDKCIYRDGGNYAHIIHRKIGGVHRKMENIINEHRNMVWVCKPIHDIIDKRIKYPEKERQEIIETLKQKIGWYEWAEQYKEELRGLIK